MSLAAAVRTSLPEKEPPCAVASDIMRPLASASEKSRLTVTSFTRITGLIADCVAINPRSTKLAPKRLEADSAASGLPLKYASISACAICFLISSGV